jgi:hypothetical protein
VKIKKSALVLTFLSIVLFTQSSLCFAEKIKTEAANTVARKWLTLIDTDQYDKSWDEGAAPFKDAVTKPDWNKSLTEARDVLGKLLKRTLKSQKFTTTVPNSPIGKYVLIEFISDYETKKKVLETITPMLESDGKWRVSGYFVSFQK